MAQSASGRVVPPGGGDCDDDDGAELRRRDPTVLLQRRSLLGTGPCAEHGEDDRRISHHQGLRQVREARHKQPAPTGHLQIEAHLHRAADAASLRHHSHRCHVQDARSQRTDSVQRRQKGRLCRHRTRRRSRALHRQRRRRRRFHQGQLQISFERQSLAHDHDPTTDGQATHLDGRRGRGCGTEPGRRKSRLGRHPLLGRRLQGLVRPLAGDGTQQTRLRGLFGGHRSKRRESQRRRRRHRPQFVGGFGMRR